MTEVTLTLTVKFRRDDPSDSIKAAERGARTLLATAGRLDGFFGATAEIAEPPR